MTDRYASSSPVYFPASAMRSFGFLALIFLFKASQSLRSGFIFPKFNLSATNSATLYF